MGKARHITRIAALAAGLMLAPAGASAQSASDGDGLMRQGVEALNRSEYQTAAQNFSKAIRAGDFSSEQIARALYRRGEAYQKLGRPANAIADISSALWLGGLSQEEQARAYSIRGRAYQAVDMGNLARADLERAGGAGTASVQSGSGSQGRSSSPSASSFSTRVEAAERTERRQRPPRPAQEEERVSAFQTRVQQDSPPAEPPPAPREKPAVPAEQQAESAPQEPQSPEPRAERPPQQTQQPEPVPEFRTAIEPDDDRQPPPQSAAAQTQSSSAGADSGSTSTTASAASGTANAEEEDSNGTVGGFLGNLWRRATGDDDEKQASVNTARAAPATASQWQDSTQVNTGGAGNDAGESSPPGGEGRYRIQIAALRSEDEAQATWRRLVAQHEDLLSGREPVIEKTELGRLGTFYRVQLGPFSDKTETLRLCNEFKRKGVDCFLLTR